MCGDEKKDRPQPEPTCSGMADPDSYDPTPTVGSEEEVQ